MLVIGGSHGDSTASISLRDPKPQRIQRALEPGKSVRMTLEGTVHHLTVHEKHADVELDLHDVAVRPEGRRTISSLIEAKQKQAVR